MKMTRSLMFTLYMQGTMIVRPLREMKAAMMNIVAQGKKLRIIQNFFRVSMLDGDMPGKIRARCGVWGVGFVSESRGGGRG